MSLEKNKIYTLRCDLCFFYLTRFIAIFLSFPCISDVPYYFELFQQAENLKFYSEFNFEYPPLAIIPIYFSGLIAKTSRFDQYYFSFSIIMFLFDCLCLHLCRKFCNKNLKMDIKQIAYMTWLYSIFGLILFRLIYHRLDIIVATIIAASLITFDGKNKKLKISFFCINYCGFFYKIIPAFIMPAAIIIKAFSTDLVIKKIIKKIILNSIVFLLFLLITIFAFEIYTNHNFVKNILFHQERGIQIESGYSSILLMINLLTKKISLITYNYGGFNIECDSYLEFIARFLGFLILFLFYAALFFVLIYQSANQQKIKIFDEIFLESSLIIILIFLSFQRVLSPQFFIWLIPLASIWLTKNRSVFNALIFIFLFFTTFCIFSISYSSLINQAPIMIWILFLRNILLIYFTCFFIRNFFKKLLVK